MPQNVLSGLEASQKKGQYENEDVYQFRSTQFSYRMGVDGVETFVSTPELQNAEGIGTDPLPPGHVWGISPGGQEEGAGMYRIEVNETPGSGFKIANAGASGPLRESVRTAYQNLLARNKELIGERDAKQHELTVQVRAMDPAREGRNLGLPILLAYCSSLLARSLRGGLVIVGGLSIGGSFELIHNAVRVAELAVEKGAQIILFPVSARRQLNDLSDDMAARITVIYYVDTRDALSKAIAD